MRAALRLLVVAVILLAVSADSKQVAAQSALPGWSYTMNMTTDSGGGTARSSFAMRQQITDRFLRMEFVQASGSSSLASIEGMYQVFDGVDSTMTMVMPSQHMATVMGLGMIEKPMIAAASPTMTQHLTRSDLEDLGAGERISGHATHHVRVTTGGTFDMTIMGQTCTQRLESVSDIWIAPDVDFGAVASAFATKLGGMLGTAAPAIENAGIKAAVLPKGAALRTVSKSTRVDARGVPVTVTTTMELLDINHRPIDAALFAIPADFQKMDMRKMMADMPAGMMDSAMKAGAATAQEARAKTMCPGGGI